MTNNKQKDNLIWWGIGLNIFILILMGIYALSIWDDKGVLDILRTIWFLSFGWICGRLSRL